MTNKGKKLARDYLMLAAMLSSNDSFITEHENKKFEELTEQEREEIRKKIEEKKKQVKRNRGLKEFVYNDVSVFAINKKNADRKARKQGLI